ncbi:MAG: transposase [bacterium]|nr:transposase [bacterium]
MPRTGRIEIENTFYHVICRGQRKDKIFLCDDDMECFVTLLKKTLKRTDIELFAFCLMPNHYHLLLKRNKDKIEKFLRIINTRYAIYFNNKYGFSGHVFQDRAKSFVVLSEKYLYTIVIYIHGNPSRKGFVKDPCDYKYSSALVYKTHASASLINYIKPGMVYDYDQMLNKKDEYFGEEKDFLKLEKRKQRINKKYKNKRFEDESLEKDLEIISKKICCESEKEKRKLIAKQLYERGYTINEIAVVFKKNKCTISKWLSF